MVEQQDERNCEKKVYQSFDHNFVIYRDFTGYFINFPYEYVQANVESNISATEIEK